MHFLNALSFMVSGTVPQKVKIMVEQKLGREYMPANMACRVFGFATYRQFGLYIDRHEVRQQKDGRRRWVHVADLAWVVANSPPPRRADWPNGQAQERPSRLADVRVELKEAIRRNSVLQKELDAAKNELAIAEDGLIRSAEEHNQEVQRLKENIALQKTMLQSRRRNQ